LAGPIVFDVPKRQNNHEKAAASCLSPGAVLPISAEVPFDEKDRAFEIARDQFEPKRHARPGDWLARFNETGLTFDEYVALRPTGPRGERQVIVLQPLGAFTQSDMNELRRLAEYTEAFFNRPVRIASTAALPRKNQRSRHEGSKSWFQHHTRTVLEMLSDSLLPKDAICTLGITLGDLYPESSWNYVFGEATLSKRVGVYSLARYRAKFWGEPETPASRRLATLRSFKVLAHEAGHMFSLVHCRRFECLMNGSNSLEEMDRATLELCPVCLKMLTYNLRFDVRSRYRRLARIYEQASLTEQRDWVNTRLAKLGC
jgi:archaemetzincin